MLTDIREEMDRQSQNAGGANFWRRECKRYKGSLSCEYNVFIAFEGANMSNCGFYEPGRRCRHCGLIS